jgi:uncharacterized protein YqgV (UPF0045/DUF77 family)
MTTIDKGAGKGADKGAEEGPDQGRDQGSDYMISTIVGCQFSVYPLRQDDIGIPIRDAIAAADAEGCSVRVGNLSTLLTGSEDEVFLALRAAFRAAQLHGPAVLTATLAAGMPTDELVGEIQGEVTHRTPRGSAAEL